MWGLSLQNSGSLFYDAAVPRGLQRFHESGQSHLVTFSCYSRRKHRDDPRLADISVRNLEQTRSRFRLRVFGYVVMPEHVHLLISEPENSTLARAIQGLKISVARAALPLAVAPLWQRRYYDHNVRSHNSFVEKLRYIHRNPVKRGLCATPLDWNWSSFRHYATAEIGMVEIESQWTADRRAAREPRLLAISEE